MTNMTHWEAQKQTARTTLANCNLLCFGVNDKWQPFIKYEWNKFVKLI